MHFKNFLRLFCKFPKLINTQRVENQRNIHNKRHILTSLTVLIVMTTFATANDNVSGSGSGSGSKSGSEIEANSSHDSHHNVVNLELSTALLASRDNRNTSDDFEQILTAQLQREEEEESNEQDQHLNSVMTGDYDTAAVAQRKSLLSRKRRYLLFPEGSSFQVVYDGIIGIVDYTSYLILGITVALAWALPSKAPSEMLEDIEMQIKQGSLLLPRNDSATNISYVDGKDKISKNKTQPNQQQQRQQFYQNQKQYMKPNYIDFYGQKSNYSIRPKYGQNYYYSTNKRPVFQSVFQPPMHGDYYYRHLNQSPKAYYHTKPGYAVATSTKYGTPSYNYGKEHYGDWRRKDDYYYKAVSRKPMNPFSKWLPSQSYMQTSSNSRTKFPWWNLANRLTNSVNRPAKIVTGRQFNDAKGNESESGYYQSSAPISSSSSPSSSASFSSASSKRKTVMRIPRKHRIYPVFGKRSLPDTHNLMHKEQQPAAGPHDTQQPHYYHHEQNQYQTQHEHRHQHHHQDEYKDKDEEEKEKVKIEEQHHQEQQQRQRRRCGIANDELSKFDRIHIRHHRHTRHTLYDKIEKYLDKRDSHGHHCVLRALCETGQKSNEHEPGSFLGELMRTLFTLPEPVDEDLQRLEYKETRYDAAHSFKGNCATRYFHCKESLWSSHFIA